MIVGKLSLRGALQSPSYEVWDSKMPCVGGHYVFDGSQGAYLGFVSGI